MARKAESTVDKGLPVPNRNLLSLSFFNAFILIGNVVISLEHDLVYSATYVFVLIPMMNLSCTIKVTQLIE